MNLLMKSRALLFLAAQYNHLAKDSSRLPKTEKMIFEKMLKEETTELAYQLREQAN